MHLTIDAEEYGRSQPYEPPPSGEKFLAPSPDYGPGLVVGRHL